MHKLKITFKLNSSIITDENFYFEINYATVLLKIYEKLSDD